MLQSFILQPNISTGETLAIPVFLGGNGKSETFNVPAIQFSFDADTGDLSGPDGEVVSEMVQQAYSSGVEVVYNFHYPIAPPLTLEKLGTILAPYYKVAGHIPQVNIPDSLFTIPDGAVS